MKKQKKQMSKLTMGVILGVLGIFLVGGVMGMMVSIGQVRETAIARTPEAILASAGVEDGANIDLAVTYFDQKQDECVNLYDEGAEIGERQFEWTSCGYGGRGIETGLVDYELGEDYLPVALGGGSLTVNRGVTDMTRWFAVVEGKSRGYSGSLQLKYQVNDGQAEFSYENDEFYPLDEAKFSEDDAVNKDRHNHLFTMNFAVPFTVMASGEESFEIKADDDTFVYVGDKLAIDMGGVHAATTGRFVITEEGEVYAGVDGEDLAYSGITVDGGSIVRIYHADRDSESSKFMVKFSGMNLNVTKSELAEADGIQMAYDPSDPSYVAPLGETMVFRPDGTRGFIIVATVMGMVIVVSSVLAVTVIKRLVRK